MNNLEKDKITIIIINQRNKHINVIINNFKTMYNNSDIIVINQEDNNPYQCGQLFNIAFKHVNTEYVLFTTDNFYNLNKIDLIDIYKNIKQPFIPFNSVSVLSFKYNEKFEIINESDNSNNINGLFFMKTIDFKNCGGFSNLCFNNGHIYDILDYKLHHLQKINNSIGYFNYPNKNIFNKSLKNNKAIKDLYFNNEMEFYEDGYMQTICDIIYDYKRNNIRFIGVDNIRVLPNYKYIDIYNKYLKEAIEDLQSIKTYDNGVSICITAYKSSKTIKDTLDSVIRQTWFQKYNNWEILLGIDHCEETLQYVKKIMNNYKNLRVFMMDSNKGTYVTTNTLMKIAKYENLIRFDSDDIMCPNLVETVMNNENNYDVQVFRFAYLLNKSKTTRTSLGQAFIKKYVFEKYGGYRDWKCAADYDFMMRIYKFVKFKKLKDQYLFYYRTDQNSLTHNNETGLKSQYRKQLHEFTELQQYDKEENVIINCVVNTYKEIYSNIYEYDQNSYMSLVIENNDWPNLC